jgi:hypothetical protein
MVYRKGITMKRTTLVLLAVLAMPLCGTRQARADGITYTESDPSVTGSIGKTLFTDAMVIITVVGDTSNVTSSGGHFKNGVGTTATVTISGLGTFEFTDAMSVFDNQTNSFAGVSDLTLTFPPPGRDVLDTHNSAFGTYGLQSDIGPLTGTAFFNSGVAFGTTGGPLIFTGVDADSTFSARVAEPSSLMLLCTAFAGVALVRRRRLA